MNEIAKKITENLRLRDVMEFYGVQFNSRGFAKCPFHTEKTASLSIKNEHYKCFGCGAYGSVIDFVMNYYGLKFMQAVVRLDSDFHLGIISGRRATYRENAERASQAIIERAYKKCCLLYTSSFSYFVTVNTSLIELYQTHCPKIRTLLVAF